MNSAKTYTKFRSKITSVLQQRWSSTVEAWNAEAIESDRLPAGEKWVISVGYPASTAGIEDGLPMLNVTFDASQFRINLSPNKRDETVTVSVLAAIYDSTHEFATSVSLVSIAARLAADLIEGYGTDSPGDPNGVSYRTDWKSLQPYSLPNYQTGAACKVTLATEVRADLPYSPSAMPSVTIPAQKRSDFVYGFDFSVLDGATEVFTRNVIFGQNFSASIPAATSLLIPAAPGDSSLGYPAATWTAGYATNDEYLIANQNLPVSFVDGDATVDLASFASLTTGQSLTIRVILIDTSKSVSTYFVLKLTKS